MHLSVDDAGQDVKTRRVDRLPSRAFAKVADRGNALAPYANIGKAFAGMVDDTPPLEHEIEGFSQGPASLAGLRPLP